MSCGRTRIQCRFEDRTLWLSQAQMGELFQTSVPNTNLLLKRSHEESELAEDATAGPNSMIRQDGARRVTRAALHCHLARRRLKHTPKWGAP